MNKTVKDFSQTPMMTVVSRNFDLDLNGKTEDEYLEEDVLKVFICSK